MQITGESTKGGIYTIDTEKLYTYTRRKGCKDEEQFIVQLKLLKYLDGEGYGTMYHYGYVFIIKEIIKKWYNYSNDEDYDIGTFPDLCAEVEEIGVEK